MLLKVYIPQLLVERLHYRLEQIPPSKNFIDNLTDELEPLEYKIENFYFILSILCNPKANGFKTKIFNGFTFVPLSSVFLKNKIGNNYKCYINYLVNQGFIHCWDKPSQNECRHFHLWNSFISYNHNNNNTFYSFIEYTNSNTQSPINIELIVNSKNRKEYNLVEVTFTNKSSFFTIKKKKYEQQLDRIRKSDYHLKEIWKEFKKKMTLNYDDAEKYCSMYLKQCTKDLEKRFENNLIDKSSFIKAKGVLMNHYIHRIASVRNLKNAKKNKSWLFSRKGVNRRLNTNLTMMASDLRQFIVGYENLSYLDLTNSQPVLFNAVLQKLKDNASMELKMEIDRYFELTISGNWYEELGNIFNCDRDEGKQKWMLIAYSKNKQCLGLKKKFKNEFPEIHKIIKENKNDDYRKFSISLQKTESKIFIDEICKLLVEQGIFPLTIHDGVLVPKEKKEQTYNIMIDVLKTHIGGVPVIEIDGIKRYL